MGVASDWLLRSSSLMGMVSGVCGFVYGQLLGSWPKPCSIHFHQFEAYLKSSLNPLIHCAGEAPAAGDWQAPACLAAFVVMVRLGEHEVWSEGLRQLAAELPTTTGLSELSTGRLSFVTVYNRSYSPISINLISFWISLVRQFLFVISVSPTPNQTVLVNNANLRDIRHGLERVLFLQHTNALGLVSPLTIFKLLRPFQLPLLEHRP
jgi:hypothetical protein